MGEGREKEDRTGETARRGTERTDAHTHAHIQTRQGKAREKSVMLRFIPRSPRVVEDTHTHIHKYRQGKGRVLAYSPRVVEVHGGEEVLRDGAVDEAPNGRQAGAGEDHVRPAARGAVGAVPALGKGGGGWVREGWGGKQGSDGEPCKTTRHPHNKNKQTNKRRQ